MVGFSDHTLGSAIPIASIGFGASIVEKHFIVNRVNKTADSFFSATPEELVAIVKGTKMVQEAIGEVKYPEEGNPQRCLIVINDTKKGELLSIKNIKSLRPGGGIEPKYFDQIIDKYSAARNISKGTLLQWDMVKPN